MVILPCDGLDQATYVNVALNSSSTIDNCFVSQGLHDLVSCLHQDTYVNVALNSSSTIDHCFVSQEQHDLVSNVSIIDSAINLSDHGPLHLQFDINWSKDNISLAHSYR